MRINQKAIVANRSTIAKTKILNREGISSYGRAAVLARPKGKNKRTTVFHHRGALFRKQLKQKQPIPLMGIHDMLSAKLVESKEFGGVFLSGFSYAASLLGVPDIGITSRTDIENFASHLSTGLNPKTHILVDIDDGFGDEHAASRIVSRLEQMNISAVMFEDQERPRRCGHFEGKKVLPLDQYLIKLKAALAVRKNLVVIARTDATDIEEGIARAKAYAEAGADGVMVEAVPNFEVLKRVVQAVKVPVMFNQLHGGKTPNIPLPALAELGVKIVIYSTATVSSAMQGMIHYLDNFKRTQVLGNTGALTMKECLQYLTLS